MPAISFRNLRASHELTWFIVDMVMLALLFINLTWLILDWLYAFDAVQDTLMDIAPELTEAYRPIHRNIFYYDLAFVAIFLTEFMVRWIRAIIRREYARWYFFPFIHWYDLLGCIPLAGWRVLRALRIISILHRLHRYQVLDLTQLKVWRFFKFYYEAFWEELSDRIVMKVLSGAQDEVKEGTPILHRLQQEVLLPRRELIVDWLSDKVAEASKTGYLPHEPDLRVYLERIVDDAMQRNTDLGRIRQIPMFGTTVSDTLERAVGDITAEIIHQILQDLASRDNHAFIEDLTSVFLKPEPHVDTDLDIQLKQVIHETLELVKEQVSIKRWRREL